jgi:outer membrane protein TolC
MTPRCTCLMRALTTMCIRSGAGPRSVRWGTWSMRRSRRRTGARMLLPIVVLAGLSLAPRAFAQTFLTGSPDELAALAVERDPALQAIVERRDSALNAGAAAQRFIVRPVFGYEARIGPGPDTHMLLVEHMFPWFGTLERAGMPALIEAQAFESAFADRALDLILQIRLAALEVARMGDRIELIEQRRAVLADIVEHETSAMAYMGGTYTESLEMTLMLAMLDDQLVEFGTMRESMLQELVAMLGGDLTVAVEADAFVDAWNGIEADGDVLVAAMDASSPGFAAMREMADAEVARAQVERDMALPMPSLELGVGLMADEDEGVVGHGGSDSTPMLGVMGMVSVRIPVVLGRAAFEGRADAMQDQADALIADLEAMRRMARGNIEQAIAEAAGARERLGRLERDLLPLAAAITEHTLAELGRGPATYVDVLRAVDRELQLLAERIDVRFALATALVRADRYSAGYLSNSLDASWRTPLLDDRVTP